MKIVFVRTGQALLVGKIADLEAEKLVMVDPRMVFANQSTNTINLAPMLGGADEMNILNHDYLYEATDKEFITVYTQETSSIPDLKIVK